MLSRRKFLLSSLGFAVFPFADQPALAGRKLAARKPAARLVQQGIFSVTRQEWPPAILPDNVKFIASGLSLFTDEFGRLAIVDLKRATAPRVIGEMSGLGKRIIDFAVFGPKAYAIVLQDSPLGDSQYVLLNISLAPPSEPSVMSQMVLENFSEPVSVVANQDIICVGGVGVHGENLIVLFGAAQRGGRSNNSSISSLTVELPIVRLDLQEKRLAVLESGKASQLDYVDLYFPRSPQLRKGIRLEGDYRVMSRIKDLVLIAGITAQGVDARTAVLEPAPRLVSQLPFSQLTAVSDCANDGKNHFLLLGDRGTERAVYSIAVDKVRQVSIEQELMLPRQKDAPGLVSRLAVKDRSANIASSSGEVQILSWDKTGWHHSGTYSIPRLPASGIATWGDWVVLGAANLSLYDIAHPNKPVLVQTAELENSVKTIVGAGSYLLCLSKDALTLRKMGQLSQIVATVNVSGQQVAYDAKRQKAYVLTREGQKSTIIPVKVYSNGLALEKAIPLPVPCRDLAAQDGALVATGLNDIILFADDNPVEQVGTRKLETQALRDITVTERHLIATAVDKNSRGSLLIISRDRKELPVIGNLELPHDGAAVASSGELVVSVGRTPEGKDTTCVIDITSPSLPRILATLPSLEAASAVAIKDKMAIIAGRGFEILNLG